MPVKSLAIGCVLLLSLAALAADPPRMPPPPSPSDMDLIEFLGSIETDSASGQEVLTEIDTALLPESPEAPLHENK